jgi:hypothetical protein
MTPAVAREAAKLVKDGVSVSLAHTIDKVPAPDSPRPISQAMTLDAAGHPMDQFPI